MAFSMYMLKIKKNNNKNPWKFAVDCKQKTFNKSNYQVESRNLYFTDAS